MVLGGCLVLLALTSGTTVGSAAPVSAATGVTAVPLQTEPPTVLERKPRPQGKDGAGADRPNIILVTTDDQTRTDLRWMPFTRRLIGGAGATFPEMLTPHPLCCPARAEILTGQYAQNSGVRGNHASLLGGFSRLDGTRTIATWLHGAGYRTAFVGKYLNEYADQSVQPGWDMFNPMIVNTYGYVGYTTLNNGDPQYYPDLYNADLLTRKTNQYVRRYSREGRPFFIWVSHVSPHVACVYGTRVRCKLPPLAAERHRGLFNDVDSPSLSAPSYNETNLKDKPSKVRAKDPVRDADLNMLFRQRIRSLQAVDEGVRSTVRQLRKVGELDNTYVLFTTDNGYLMGEHRVVHKNVPYEEAIRFPLLMRGPGIPAGTVRRQTVTMLDLAPTFLDAAHAKANLRVDGHSVLPFIDHPSRPGAETVLIQAGPRNPKELPYGWAWRGVRTDRYTYVHYPAIGFVEMYDRAKDPAELHNVGADPAYLFVAAELSQRLDALRNCAGAACNRRFGPLPEPLRMAG